MSGRTSHRADRVGHLIQESLAGALTTKVKDPRVGFVTVTGVVVSHDLSYADVRVSVMGTEEDKAAAVEGLQSARGFLRTHLAHTLTMRTVPELRFQLDRGLEHAARINELLAEVRRETDEP
jgi:ribosome-binding factor A